MEVFTNIDVYWAIAREAHAAMRLDLSRSMTPNEDGSSGHVIHWTRDRQSFKNAVIAVVFAGMYLEGLIFISLQRRFGRDEAIKIDRKSYEDRLQKLGIADSELLERVKRFRAVRKDLVHEKALLSLDLVQPIRLAQEEADRAISLVREIAEKLLAPATSVVVATTPHKGAGQCEQHD